MPIRRLQRKGYSSLGQLQGVSSIRGYFPNAGVSAIVPVIKIEPFAIVRPARLAIAAYVDTQFVGSAAIRVNNVEIGFATRPRVEGDEFAIGGPPRCPCRHDTEMSQLLSVGAVGVADPYLAFAVSGGLESDPASVRRNTRS